MAGHTPKQKAFVREYLVDLNATQAAIRAGYSKKTANEQGSRLLANVKIAKAIQIEMDKRAERTEINADYVLNSIREVAERCMQRVPVMEGQGRDRKQKKDLETGEGVWSFDSSGANKSLELLGKHLKLFTDKVEHSASDDLASLINGFKTRAGP